MTVPDIRTIVADPDFQALPYNERRRALSEMDPDFAKLPIGEQDKALSEMTRAASPEPTGFFEAAVETGEPSMRKAARVAAPMVRPGLEIGGLLGGGLLATPADVAAGPAPTILGAGLGYSAMSALADLIDEYGGGQQTPSLGGRLMKGAEDVAKGSAFEAGGQVAGKYILEPLIGGAIRRAGNILNRVTGKSPEYAANAAEADALESAIPGWKASIGEKRNDPGLLQIQRGLERKAGTPAAHAKAEITDQNSLILRDYLDTNFGGKQSVDDVLASVLGLRAQAETATREAAAGAEAAAGRLATTRPQEAGSVIVRKNEEALAPIKTQERTLWGKVDNYGAPTANTNAAFQDVLKTPSMARKLVKRISKVYEETPKTVAGMQSIEREINSAMYDRAATQTEKHFLGKLKDGIRSDMEALGKAADAGDIYLYKGNIVSPGSLSEEAAKLMGDISKAEATAKPNVDMEKVVAALKAKNMQAMQVVQEGRTSFVERMVQDYKRVFQKDPPTLPMKDSDHVAWMKNRALKIKQILAESKPAQNVAEQIRTARDFSRTKFERFDRGAVRDIMKFGRAPNSRAIPDEQIASRFMTPSNADQLIKALGDQAAAGKAMEGFVATDMQKNAVNPTTKEIVTNAFNQWFAKNKIVLDKYGLTKSFENIGRAQETLEAAKVAEAGFNRSAAAKMLNSDPENAIAQAFSGAEGLSPKNTAGIMTRLMEQVKGDKNALAGLKNAFKDFIIKRSETTAETLSGQAVVSPAQIQKALDKYRPAMQVLYRDEPAKLKALLDVQKAIKISSRSIGPVSKGGSDTAELMAAQAFMDLAGHGVKFVGGRLFLPVDLARKGYSVLRGISLKQTEGLLTRAMYDPELAEALLMARKGSGAKYVERTLREKLISIGITGASSYKRQE